MAERKERKGEGILPSPPPELPAGGERFAKLFRGLPRAYGVYEITHKKGNGSKKVEGKARTVRGEVTTELWHRHFLGEQSLGVVPINDEGQSFFGAIDVDHYDLSIEEVEKSVAALGVPLLPTRTKSGGIHLYAFAAGDAGVPARLLRMRLAEWATALGFPGVEIFPKQDALHSAADVGNWINMPYFGGDATERYGIHKGKRLALKAFCARAEKLRVTEAQLEALVVEAAGEDFEEAPPCLQSISKRGFGEGMRNNGLFAVGVYLRKRYPDSWQSQLLSYNVRYFSPPLSELEVKGVVKSVGRKDYFYPCKSAPCVNFCNKELCRKRAHGIGGSADDWGITIDNTVLKIATDPPYWLITVNGARLCLYSEDILQQRRFQELCVRELGFYPAALPADKWREEMNKMLAAATPVAAPKDASISGELGYYLEQFCTVYPQAETREEIAVGKPFTEEGYTHFRAADFKRFLEQNHFRALQGHKLYAELRRMGLEHKQYWVGEQNLLVWVVKAYNQPQLNVPPRSPPRDATAM